MRIDGDRSCCIAALGIPQKLVVKMSGLSEMGIASGDFKKHFQAARPSQIVGHTCFNFTHIVLIISNLSLNQCQVC